jgi:CPA2 family monovalent cation:H+ antiporter-2
MIHLPALIQDLGLILIAAAIVTLVFKKLKQPVVLGYLVAGFLVGPHIPLLPSVVDRASIQTWAEIGVIFLLFGLGLEFSFKKLAKVGKPASITALFEILFMIGIGYLTGQILDWSRMDSLFLGGILAISSTTIIVRAFDELGLKGRRFVSLVFGVLIVEDLIAILLLVLLSTIAATQQFAGGELMAATARLGFFLVLWFVVGIYLIPNFLKRIHNYLNDETALVVSLGLCLLMVILATKVGFSPALGAFVMGSILAETREGRRIEHLIMPVRDLFAAVFFVSVGMLIDPQVLMEYGWVIALVTFMTIFGKFLSTAIGSLVSGQSLRHSVQAGMSLAQIGEFSFIIATLGVTLKVTSDFLYPVAVAVSAITTFTTPFQIREADRFANWLERVLPDQLLHRLSRYETAFSDRRSGEDAASFIWRAYGMKVLLNSVVVVGITLGVSRLLLPKVVEAVGGREWIPELTGAVTLVLVSPFFWGVVLGKPTAGAVSTAQRFERLKTLQFGVTLFRGLIGMALLFFVINQFTRTETATVMAVGAFALIFLLFSRFAEPLYRLVENRFVENLNDKEQEELSRARAMPALAPWDATLSPMIVSPDSDFVGQTLMESSLKEKFGVTVAMIDRGQRRIQAPTRNDRLMPGDRLYLIGTENQLEAARSALETKGTPVHWEGADTFGLESVVLHEGAPYVHKPIRECGLREEINGLIVGIERKGNRILNPDSSLALEPGDLVWLVGDRIKIRTLNVGHA